MFSLEYFNFKTLIHDLKTLLYHEPGESMQIHNKSTRQPTNTFHHINEIYRNMKDLLYKRSNETNRSEIERKKEAENADLQCQIEQDM